MGIVKMIALQATASILLLSAIAVSGACPDKWLDASFMEMGCLFFNNTVAVDWEEANVVCKMTPNATLVDIQSEMQMGFLQMELNMVEGIEGTKHNWWTAGTDVGIEGQWFWVTTLTEVGDFVWHSDEPNSGTAYNCLYLSYGGYEGYDYNCESALYPICQILQ